MKKSIIVFLALVFSLAVSAQRNKPLPVYTDEVQFSDFTTQDLLVYYMYNTKTGMFYNEGNEYGTRASLSDYGLKVALSKYYAKNSSDEILPWDGKTIYVHNYTKKKDVWDQLFVDNKCVPYVDCNNRGDNRWVIVSRGKGIYRIQLSKSNSVSIVLGYTELDLYLGISGTTLSSNQNGLSVIDVSKDTKACIDWAFVAEKDYDEYVANMDIYAAAEKLNSSIAIAKKYNIDVESYEAIYNDETSTLEVILSATQELSKLVDSASYAESSDENPYDVTGSIVNPNFTVGNATGWVTNYTTNKNTSEYGYKTSQPYGYNNGNINITQFFQAWSNGVVFGSSNVKGALGVGEMSQTIEGLPEGKYKLCADCISTNQYIPNENPVEGVEMFANGGFVDCTTKLATEDKAPQHFELLFPSNGEKIKIGIRTTESCTANWVAASNFKLYYLGHDYTAIEGVSTNSDSKESAIYTLSGARVNSFKKGINIIRNADGSVSKMYVK